jgi:hypothetical protein
MQNPKMWRLLFNLFTSSKYDTQQPHAPDLASLVGMRTPKASPHRSAGDASLWAALSSLLDGGYPVCRNRSAS